MEPRGLPLNQTLDARLNLVRQVEKLERGIVPSATIRARAEALLYKRFQIEDRESYHHNLGYISSIAVKGECALVGGGTGQVLLAPVYARDSIPAHVPRNGASIPSHTMFLDSHRGGGGVTHCEWYPFDDGMCLTSGVDARVCVWDVSERTVATEFSHPSSVRSCAFSSHMSTATLILSAGDELRLCDLVSGTCTQILGEGVHELRQAYVHQSRFLHPLHRPSAPALSASSLDVSHTRQHLHMESGHYLSVGSVAAALSASGGADAERFSSGRAASGHVPSPGSIMVPSARDLPNTSHVWSCAWHPTREYVVFSGDSSGTVRGWDIRGGSLGDAKKPICILNLNDPLFGVGGEESNYGLDDSTSSSHPEELTIDSPPQSSDSSKGVPRIHTGGICQILFASAKSRSRTRRLDNQITSLSGSHSDQDVRMATTGVDGRVRLWAGKNLQPMPVHIGPTHNRHWLQKSAITSDAKYLFYPEGEGVKLFDLDRASASVASHLVGDISSQTSQSPMIAKLRGHMDRVLCVGVASTPPHTTREYHYDVRGGATTKSDQTLPWLEDENTTRAMELCIALREAGYISSDEMSNLEDGEQKSLLFNILLQELDEATHRDYAYPPEPFTHRVWSSSASFVPRFVSGCAAGLFVRWSALGKGENGLDDDLAMTPARWKLPNPALVMTQSYSSSRWRDPSSFIGNPLPLDEDAWSDREVEKEFEIEEPRIRRTKKIKQSQSNDSRKDQHENQYHAEVWTE